MGVGVTACSTIEHGLMFKCLLQIGRAFPSCMRICQVWKCRQSPCASDERLYRTEKFLTEGCKSSVLRCLPGHKISQYDRLLYCDAHSLCVHGIKAAH